MRTMKVLDLDMDFFLTDACPLAPLGERPPEACAEPYSDEQVIRFLEMQESQYHAQQQYIAESARLRHDFRQ